MRWETTTDDTGRVLHSFVHYTDADGVMWDDPQHTIRANRSWVPEFTGDGATTPVELKTSCELPLGYYLTPGNGRVSDASRERTDLMERNESRNAALVAKEMLVFGPHAADPFDDLDFQHELDEVERREAEIERQVEEQKL